MSKSKLLIVGLGEVLWDIFPTGPRLGGAPTNFAAHAAALGANAALVSSIGNDLLGEQTIEALKRLGVESTAVSRNEYPTGTVQVTVSDGEPSYSIASNVAWDHCRWNDSLEVLAQKIDAVCFGSLFQRSSINRETTKSFLQATRTDCLRVFDVNLRQSFYTEEIIVHSLQLANVLKLNRNELAVVAKAAGIETDEHTFIQNICDQFGMKLVALTCGGDGSWLGDAKDQHFFPASPVEVVDTVGAGDSFTAAIVIGLLDNLPIAEVHENASRLAARVCGHAGAIQI